MKTINSKIQMKSNQICLKQTTPKHTIIKTGEKWGGLKKDKGKKGKKTPFLQGNK